MRTTLRRSGTRDERGVAFPSPLVMLSVVAVAMAGIAFLATQDDGSRASQLQPVARPSASAVPSTPRPSATRTPEPKPSKRKPVVRRGEVYVEVYNNSGITGLAKRIADRAAGAGWQVVGADNWYGTIPTSTVYYPQRLEAAARLMARDLGIGRVQHAVDPMRGDRLTVILTGDLG